MKLFKTELLADGIFAPLEKARSKEFGCIEDYYHTKPIPFRFERQNAAPI